MPNTPSLTSPASPTLPLPSPAAGHAEGVSNEEFRAAMYRL
ncbi:reductase, partial [Streptomyces sp. 4F]